MTVNPTHQMRINKAVARFVILTNIYCILAVIRLAIYFVGGAK